MNKTVVMKVANINEKDTIINQLIDNGYYKSENGVQLWELTIPEVNYPPLSHTA